VLAFLAAWAATRGSLDGVLSPEGLLGAATATLLILALYPLTQLYQVDEDRARGDRTLAVVLGPRRCFGLSIVCMLIGGTLMLGVLMLRFGALDAFVVGAGLLVQVTAVAWWAVHYDPHRVLANYRHVMRLNTLSAGALAVYLLARLAAFHA
jgi:4-hydroxybenzoate polyprenyltransferase